jgi:GTP-binding protein
MSSTAHLGLKEVLRELRRKVIGARELINITDEDDEDIETISLGKEKIAESWQVDRIEEDEQIIFTVSGEKIEKFARRTTFGNYEAENRLRDIMKKFGIAHELRRRGAEGTSIIRIADGEFTFIEQ